MRVSDDSYFLGHLELQKLELSDAVIVKNKHSFAQERDAVELFVNAVLNPYHHFTV